MASTFFWPRQITDLRDTNKSRYLAITSSIIVLSFDHRVCFLMNIFGKPSDLPSRRRKAWFHLRMSTILFAAGQTRLEDIAHERGLICRQSFAGHAEGSRPKKRRKNFRPMIKSVTSNSPETQTKINCPVLSLCAFPARNHFYLV